MICKSLWWQRRKKASTLLASFTTSKESRARVCESIKTEGCDQRFTKGLCAEHIKSPRQSTTTCALSVT